MLIDYGSYTIGELHLTIKSLKIDIERQNKKLKALQQFCNYRHWWVEYKDFVAPHSKFVGEEK